MKWKITWRGDEFVEDDLTVAHIALVVMGLGEDSFRLTPTRGPIALAAFIAAWVAIAEQQPYPMVMEVLARVQLSELCDALTIE